MELVAITFSKISSNVDASINTVDSLLENSKNARSQFQNQWSSLIKDLQTDVAVLEDELAQFPPTLTLYMQLKEKERNKVKRQRKKKMTLTKKSASSHALNFHMMKQTIGESSNIFLLPPEAELNDGNESNVSENRGLLDKKNSDKKHLSVESKRKLEQQRKFKLRESILSKMDELHKHEAKMYEDLQDADNDEVEDDNMVRSSEIDKHQRKSNQLMMKMISQYNPKVNSHKAKHVDISKFVLNDTLHETAQILEENAKRSGKKHEDRIMKDIDNYKSIEYLPLTTTEGSLKKIVSDATTLTEPPVGDEGEESELYEEHYSEYDFESEEEDDDYGEDSFED